MNIISQEKKLIALIMSIIWGLGHLYIGRSSRAYILLVGGVVFVTIVSIIFRVVEAVLLTVLIFYIFVIADLLNQIKIINKKYSKQLNTIHSSLNDDINKQILICPLCSTKNNPNFTFCFNCGSSNLFILCQNCNNSVLGSSLFCNMCGNKL